MLLLHISRPLRDHLMPWRAYIHVIVVLHFLARQGSAVTVSISTNHLEEYFLGTENWSEVEGSEVHIVRDGQLAGTARGMLLLDNSSRHLPPFPYTVEKVSLSWSTDTPANYTLRLIEVFPNIIERPSLSISTIGRIPLTKQDFTITLPCSLIEGLGVVHVSLLITRQLSFSPLRVNFKLYKECVDPTNSIAYLVKKLELREAEEEPSETPPADFGSGEDIFSSIEPQRSTTSSITSATASTTTTLLPTSIFSFSSSSTDDDISTDFLPVLPTATTVAMTTGDVTMVTTSAPGETTLFVSSTSNIATTSEEIIFITPTSVLESSIVTTTLQSVVSTMLPSSGDFAETTTVIPTTSTSSLLQMTSSFAISNTIIVPSAQLSTTTTLIEHSPTPSPSSLIPSISSPISSVSFPSTAIPSSFSLSLSASSLSSSTDMPSTSLISTVSSSLLPSSTFFSSTDVPFSSLPSAISSRPSSSMSFSSSTTVFLTSSISPSSSQSVAVRPSITPTDTIPGRVRNVVITVFNVSSFTVSWLPPLDNGDSMLSYFISVTPYANQTNQIYWREVVGNITSHNVVSTELAGFTPYIITITVRSSAGEGPSKSRTFFTSEGAPPPVQNVRVARINGTAANVSWDPISIIEARGTLTNYTITLTPQPASSRRRRQASNNDGSISVMVPSQRSSIVVLGLNPSLQYQVSVSARTAGGGQGNDSNPIIVPPIPSPTLLPTPTKVPVEPWFFYAVVFSPLVAFLIICSAIIVLCLACLKCARMRKAQPEFQDDPHEIAEQVWFTYEDEDDKDSLEVKKEEIPVTLWMSLGWGSVTSFLLHIQTMIRTLNVDRRRLSIKERILRGTYGCLTKGTMTMESVEGLYTSESIMLKMAIGVTDDGSRRDQIAKFIEQATLLQGLEHDNILPVLGLSVEDNVIPIVIYPTTEYGNLQIFMERTQLTPGDSPISPELKVVFSHQIATAMKFLSDNNIVHPDLGLRNCWLDTNFIVKLSDGALSQEFFADCYAYIKGSLRPVKWSAIETLQEGLCTSQSNVWSFGVTMWEVMNAGRQPYSGIPNRSVLSQLMMEERLEIPDSCPGNLGTLMKNCWRRRPEERPNFTQIYAELKEMNNRYSSFQPPTQQMYLPNSQEPTFSTFQQPPSVSSRQQPVAASEPLTRHLLINSLMGSLGGNSDPMSRRFSGSRNSRQVSLSFTGLSSDSSGESDDEAAAGGGSFPSTLKSRGSTIKAEGLTGASESIATLNTSVTPQAVNRSVTPDENKSAPYDSSTSARSSIVLPAITQSLASTSNTDCSSFISTGLESMNTTYSTPTMPPNHSTTSGGIELTRLTDEKFRRDSLTAPGMSSNRSSSSSNPSHSLASVSPQTVITTKSNDSGIRSDEDSSSDNQGHQLQDTHLPKKSPKLRQAPSRPPPPPPPPRSPKPSEEDPFDPVPQLETSFSSDAARKSPQPPQEDPFGLGLGDMSSELFAAFSSFSTFKK